jgi:REP element-mobilizing transposase RayT
VERRIKVYGFVIMSNHIHLILQVQPSFKPKDIQLSFTKYSAQMIRKDLRNNHKEVLEMFSVKASDRKYQVWKESR